MEWKFSKFEIRFFNTILFAVFFTISGYMLYSRLFDNELDWSKYYERKSAKEIDGVIVGTYINYRKQAVLTLVFEDKTELEVLKMWEKNFEIGDYVNKDVGSLIVVLIKKPSEDTLKFNYKEIEK